MPGATANVSGSRRQQNSFYMDGAENSHVQQNTALQMPNVDAIVEVQVAKPTDGSWGGYARHDYNIY
jgi:urate oxidase